MVCVLCAHCGFLIIQSHLYCWGVGVIEIFRISNQFQLQAILYYDIILHIHTHTHTHTHTQTHTQTHCQFKWLLPISLPTYIKPSTD